MIQVYASIHIQDVYKLEFEKEVGIAIKSMETSNWLDQVTDKK